MCEDTRGVSTAVLWNGIRSSPPTRTSCGLALQPAVQTQWDPRVHGARLFPALPRGGGGAWGPCGNGEQALSHFRCCPLPPFFLQRDEHVVAASECFCNFCFLLLFISSGIGIRIPKFMFPPSPSTLMPPCCFYGLTKSAHFLCAALPVTPPPPVGRGATPRYPPPLAADLVTDPSTDQAPGECCPATEQHPRDRKHLGSHVGQPGMKQRTKVVTGPHVHLTWGSKTELGSTSPASSGPGLSGECSELHINSPRHTNPLPGGRERRSAWFMSLSSQPGSGFWCHV